MRRMQNISQDGIDRLKGLGMKADDDQIATLYDQCAGDFMDICNREDVPERATGIIEQMVMFRWSQLNSEGLASQSFSGASETFLGDYPIRLKRAMYRYRRLVCL